MIASRSFDLAVLGAGPAGTMAALCAAHHSDVALVVNRLPEEDEWQRIDAVPARALALLVDFGIDPRALRVERLHDQGWVAWSTRTPQIFRRLPTAHVERPLLDRVLISRALRHPRIALFVSSQWTRVDGIFWGEGWRARRLVDATGRAAVTAGAVMRSARPWAARTLWRSHRPDGRGPPFALTALPDGYAYRIEAERRVGVGFVGRGPAVEGAPDELESSLRSSGAGWMIDDLPPLAAFAEGRASTASVQWTMPSTSGAAPRPTRIGDAALARDPLASQGIAIACSEALFVASIKSAADLETFELRQEEQRRSHLAALTTMIEGCVFSTELTWRDYADFIGRHAQAAPLSPAAALRSGKVVRL